VRIQGQDREGKEQDREGKEDQELEEPFSPQESVYFYSST